MNNVKLLEEIKKKLKILFAPNVEHDVPHSLVSIWDWFIFKKRNNMGTKFEIGTILGWNFCPSKFSPNP